MPKSFKCALSSRAGRILLLGDQRIAIDDHGFVRGIKGDVLSYFQSQPGVWLEVNQAEETVPDEPIAPTPTAPITRPRARLHQLPDATLKSSPWLKPGDSKAQRQLAGRRIVGSPMAEASTSVLSRPPACRCCVGSHSQDVVVMRSVRDFGKENRPTHGDKERRDALSTGLTPWLKPGACALNLVTLPSAQPGDAHVQLPPANGKVKLPRRAKRLS